MWGWGHPEAPPPSTKVGSRAPCATGCGWHWPPPRGGTGSCMTWSIPVCTSCPQCPSNPGFIPWGGTPTPWGQLGGAGAPRPLCPQPCPCDPCVTGTLQTAHLGVPTAPNPCPGQGDTERDPNVPLRSAVRPLWVALGWYRGGTCHPSAIGGTGKGQTCPGQVPGGSCRCHHVAGRVSPASPWRERGGDTPVGATHVSEVPPPPALPPRQRPVPAALPKIAPAGP